MICGACGKEFEVRDGILNTFRVNFDDPPTPMCYYCVERLASHNVIEKDTELLLCRCGSTEHHFCFVHGQGIGNA